MEPSFVASAGSAENLFVSEKTPLPLRVGEIVRAVVKESVAPDSLLLQMRNAVIFARTDVPVKVGDVLFLRVDALGNEIRLRLVPDAGVEAEASALTDKIWSALAALKTPGPAAAEYNALKDLLNTVPDSLKNSIPGAGLLEKTQISPDGISGDILKNAVLNSGVFFETKVRILAEGGLTGPPGQNSALVFADDLKGGLLKLSNALSDPAVAAQLREAGTNVRELARAVDRLIGTIEFHQLQTRLSEAPQFFLPMLWNGLKEQWMKFKASNKGSAEQSYSCTVNLELEQTGKMRSLILMSAAAVHVKLVSDNPAFVQMVTAQTGLLAKQLESAGLKLGGLSATFKQNIDFNEELAEGLDMRV